MLSMPGDSTFFSREELVGGLPARRASTLRFAIENRTAQRKRQSGETALYRTLAGAPEREQAFLDALAQARTADASVSVQDLERYAPQWNSLLPETPDPRLVAALAHLFSEKYKFTRDSVPQLRAALDLDAPATRQAYQELYRQPLDTIYAPRVALGNRLRFAWARLAARLEALPPFWLAFGLTLPVGPGLLAVPIALAGLGPVPSILLLIFFGVINLITAAALAEAVSRSAITRFGLGYLGQLVSDYLGNVGSLFLTGVFAVNGFLVLIVFYLGIAGTLASATSIPTPIWIGIVFVAGLYFVSRRSLNTTVAFSLLVVAITLVLLVVIPLFALPYVRGEYLAYANVPFFNGAPFEPALLSLVFGVMLTNYFSHMLVANYGRVVLRRDPGARTWIQGSMAAIGVSIVISILWVVLVNGAISPHALANETGTALAPLAKLAGPIVNVLGSVLVILGLGIATIHISLGEFFLVQERLLSSGWSERVRTIISLLPVVGVFVLAEWFAITNTGSFASLLGLTGTLSLPLLGGIFPVLLLAASRRKGDFVPGVAYRWLGNPILLGIVYALFLLPIFVYGLVIYQEPLEKIATVIAGLLILGGTIVILRGDALAPRTVVELRQDRSDAGQSLFEIVADGKFAPAPVMLDYGNRTVSLHAAKGDIKDFPVLHAATFDLPKAAARELKVWTHRVTPEGNSDALPAQVEINDVAGSRAQAIGADKREVVVKTSGAPVQIRIQVEHPVK